MNGNDSQNGNGEQITKITIQNASTPGLLGDGHTNGNVVIAPGVYVVTEKRENPMFASGAEASEGLRALAEDGQTGPLVSEMEDTEGVKSVGTFDANGPITPSSTAEFKVDATEQGYVSMAAMVVPSNDTFIGTAAPIPLRFRGNRLTNDSGRLTQFLTLYDAGTEPNAPHGQGENQAPAQSEAGQGPDEGGTIRRTEVVSDDVLSPESGDIASLKFL